MQFLSLAFKATNYTALLGWLVLFSFPLWPAHGRTLLLSLIVAFLCLAYSYTVFLGKRHDVPGEHPRGGFFSLRGVISLFKTPRVVLGGWIHFLAFDLMVGLFIATDAASRGISHWLLLPALFLTLMYGPAGLLLYLAMRLVFGGEVGENVLVGT